MVSIPSLTKLDRSEHLIYLEIVRLDQLLFKNLLLELLLLEYSPFLFSFLLEIESLSIFLFHNVLEVSIDLLIFTVNRIIFL